VDIPRKRLKISMKKAKNFQEKEKDTP